MESLLLTSKEIRIISAENPGSIQNIMELLLYLCLLSIFAGICGNGSLLELDAKPIWKHRSGIGISFSYTNTFGVYYEHSDENK